MLSHTKTRLVFSAARTFTSSPLLYTSHYDVLGITPKATQSDIKSAYYKLSKIHHPDKSSDEASAKKFRAITEAYEVLGNVKLKKMYDKGLLGGPDRMSQMDHRYHPEPEPTDPTLKFYKSHNKRNVVPTMDGKTPIYNFDAWSKQHYGDLFEKTKYEKEFLRKKRAKQEDSIHSTRQETLLFSIFTILTLFVALVLQGTTDHDTDKLHRDKQNAQKSEN